MSAVNRNVGSFAARIDVVPNDAEDLPGGACRAIYVGTAGTVAFVNGLGGDDTLTSADDTYHDLMATRIKSSGTSASNIKACY